MRHTKGISAAGAGSTCAVGAAGSGDLGSDGCLADEGPACALLGDDGLADEGPACELRGDLGLAIVTPETWLG